jgi:hypothetical protein
MRINLHRRYLKRLALAFSIGLVFSGVAFWYLIVRHPILLKTVIGEARPLYPPMKAVVRLEGQVIPSAKVFAMKAYTAGNL